MKHAGFWTLGNTRRDHIVCLERFEPPAGTLCVRHGTSCFRPYGKLKRPVSRHGLHDRCLISAHTDRKHQEYSAVKHLFASGTGQKMMFEGAAILPGPARSCQAQPEASEESLTRRGRGQSLSQIVLGSFLPPPISLCCGIAEAYAVQPSACTHARTQTAF